MKNMLKGFLAIIICNFISIASFGAVQHVAPEILLTEAFENSSSIQDPKLQFTSFGQDMVISLNRSDMQVSIIMPEADTATATLVSSTYNPWIDPGKPLCYLTVQVDSNGQANVSIQNIDSSGVICAQEGDINTGNAKFTLSNVSI